MAARKRTAAHQRLDRLERRFATARGDEAIIAALDARTPTWRERRAGPAEIDFALDRAEQPVDLTQQATAEHAVVVEAEKTFVNASSAAYRQTGDRVPKGSMHARMAQRLSDRALLRALAGEREEPPASPAVVQRIITWLRARIDKLLERLGLGPAGGAATSAGFRSPSAGPAGIGGDHRRRRYTVACRRRRRSAGIAGGGEAGACTGRYNPRNRVGGGPPGIDERP